jgi:glutathione peroxidase-family protein
MGMQVVLIVNVASQCGLTERNYQQLEELYLKYHAKGLSLSLSLCTDSTQMRTIKQYSSVRCITSVIC